MADGTEKKKRKRDVDAEARITYHTPLKSFERLFNESSLEEIKRVVRTKLDLDDGADITISQIRGNHIIVLEDEDDFRAFRFMLKTNPWVELQVSVAESTRVNDAASPTPKKRKKNKSERRKRELEAANIAEPKPEAAQGVNESTTSTSTLVEAVLSPTMTMAATGSSPIASTLPVHTAGVIVPVLPKSKKTGQKASKASPATLVMEPVDSGAGNLSTMPSTKQNRKIAPKAEHEVPPREDSPVPHLPTEDFEPKHDQKEEKPKTKAARRKSTPAQVVPMSPAAREKASLILQRHRDNLAERETSKKKRVKNLNGDANPGPEGLAELIDAAMSVNMSPQAEKGSKRKKKSKISEHLEDTVEGSRTLPEEHQSSANADDSLHRPSTRMRLLPVIITNNVPPAATIANPVVDVSAAPLDMAPKSKKSKQVPDLSLCVICGASFHPRQDCHVFQDAGEVLRGRLKQLKKSKQQDLVREIEQQLESEDRKRLVMTKQRKGRGLHPIPPPPPHPRSSDDGRPDATESSEDDDDRSNVSVPRSLAGPILSPPKVFGGDALPDPASDKSDSEGTPPRQQQSPTRSVDAASLPPPPTSPSVASSTRRSTRTPVQSNVPPVLSPEVVSNRRVVNGRARPLKSNSRQVETPVGDSQHVRMEHNPKLLAMDSETSQNADSDEEQALPSPTMQRSPRREMESNEMEVDEMVSESDDDAEPPLPENPAQTTPRVPIFPRLSQMSISGVRLASNFWRSPNSSSVAKPQPISVPATQTKEKVEMAYASSSSSSSSDEDVDPRIPASQRASSRIKPVAAKRKSLLGEL